MDNYSLADIRAATGADENGWAGGGAWWIIILFLFMFGMGGGWGRGNRGKDAQTRMCDGFYAQNTTMLNGFAGVTSAVRDAQFAAQQCCCETNRNIDSVRYDAQKNTCDITMAIHAEGEATRALIQKNEMQNLRDRLQQMELREAMCGVVRYPMATTYTSGGNPFCGCNNGCNI